MRAHTTVRRVDAVPLLELRRVSAGYEGTEDVISDVTLSIEEGEVAAAVALDMSGGKSTLLRVAAGLLEPRVGQVLFRGRDVYRMQYAAEQEYRSQTAVVLEGGALLVNLSVRENVALPLHYHTRRTAREIKLTVDRLLEQCGYNEDPEALPWQVSTRGRKLAAIARALARDPSLVLVDRFFAGLEQPEWRRLFEMVMELNQNQQVSWLLISDVDPSIFQVAERVAVLDRGRLLGYDFKNKLFADPRIKAAFEAADLRTRIQRQTQRFLASEDSTRWDALRKQILAEDGPLGLDQPAPPASTLDDVRETINIDGRMPGLEQAIQARVLERSEEEGPNAPTEARVPDPLGPSHQTTINLPPEELAHVRDGRLAGADAGGADAAGGDVADQLDAPTVPDTDSPAAADDPVAPEDAP